MANGAFQFTLSRFTSVRDTRPPGQMTLAWERWQELTKGLGANYAKKEDMPLISGMIFGQVQGKSSYRHDANVLAMSGVVVDIDHCQHVTIAEAQKRIEAAGLAALLYSSPSHQPGMGTERYRAVFLLSEWKDPAGLPAACDHVNALLGGVVAPESWRLSQPYYWGRVVGAPWQVAAVNGEFLDVAMAQLGVVLPAYQAVTASAGGGSTAGNGKPHGGPAGGAGGPIPVSTGYAPRARVARSKAVRAVVEALRTSGQLLEERKDGSLALTCPFESEHTSPNTPGDCVLFPPHTGGFSKWNAHCMHAHCQGRTQEAFWQGFGFPLPTKVATPELERFWYVPEADAFLFVPLRKLWPARGVDSFIEPAAWPMGQGNEVMLPSDWLRRNRQITQQAWLPGEPAIVEGQLWIGGRMRDEVGAAVFNTWQQWELPTHTGGIWAPDVWQNHGRLLYGSDWAHIEQALAFKVQNPGVKVNHALVLAGAPGIGKDALLFPLKQLVGSSWGEIDPGALLHEQFNGYLANVFLRVNELKGPQWRDRLYLQDALKPLCTSPPETLSINRKGIERFDIPNVVQLIITTNHRTALELEANDRRLFFAWSDMTLEQLPGGEAAYFKAYWDWMTKGGAEAVMIHLMKLDVRAFRPAGAPPRTDWRQELAEASVDMLTEILGDALDMMGRPEITSMPELQAAAGPELMRRNMPELTDKAQLRKVGNTLRELGYDTIRQNGAAVRRNVAGRVLCFYRRHDAVGDSMKLLEKYLIRFGKVK